MFRYLSWALAWLAVVPEPVLSKPMPSPVAQVVQPSTTVTPGGSACGQNNATNRACWKNNWNINTDYETTTPPGTTRNIDLYITNVTSYSADGVPKRVMLVNGIFPAPPIIANWGDYLDITIHNQLQDNGTSFHWHGVRQLNSNNQDGANGVTECPIPPGSSRAYTFRAQQYGTSWYHSHFSVQYGNGVAGAIVINGPAAANYDIDLGPYMITDWYHQTADVLQLKAEQATGPPPPSDNVLFNGTNINPSGSGGAYNKVTLTPGKKHLLRLINPSVENHFTVTLVGHSFTVIAVDLVPVKPVVKSQLFLGIGQRYDVIIDASQPIGNYWFNATLGGGGLCGASNNLYPASIFSYQGAPTSLPTNRGSPVNADCHDSTGFTPIISRSADPSTFAANEKELSVALTTAVTNRGTIFSWQVNGSAMDVQWEKPILQYIAEGNFSFPRAANVVEITATSGWTYVVIDNTAGLPHPIHLHGHDFLVLGSSDSGKFNLATDQSKLNFVNPVRRDVAMLPGGWLVIAFEVNNPGAWIMHCHIAWHVSQGLSVQFLELKSQIPTAMHLDQVKPTCDAWKAYLPNMKYPKIDSGL
ncbi:laccase-2 [Coniochaeta sp. 2T2.1]|nr:laccase-2 [Coniochaeta sp. 2T2.1]